jgi:hypothetical protein
MMSTFPNWFNTGAYVLLFGVLCVAVMSPRMHGSVVIKTGMATMALGFFGLLCLQTNYWQDAAAIAWGHAFVHLGLLITVVGHLMRQRRAGQPRRRASDFAGLGPK